MTKPKPAAVPLDIKHPLIDGGRMSISSGTSNKRLAAQRRAAVMVLLERGDRDAIRRLRRRELHIADVAAAVREGDWDRLLPPAAADETLQQAIDATLESKNANPKERTRSAYQVTANQLLAAFGGDTLLTRITTEDARGWLLGLKANGKPWAPRTINQRQALAGVIWRQAIQRREAAAERAGVRVKKLYDVWSAVEVPQVRPTRHVWFTGPELAHLLHTARGRPIAGMLAVGGLAGLRASEILQLRTGLDVDFEERRIRVQNRPGWTTKTHRSQRDVPMVPELYDILQEHVRLGLAGQRYFFRPAREDRPFSYEWFRDMASEAFKAAGFAYGGRGHNTLSLHSLRHTAATLLVQEGAQLVYVAQVLGDHISIVTDTYLHHAPSDLARTMALLSNALTTSTEGEK